MPQGGYGPPQGGYGPPQGGYGPPQAGYGRGPGFAGPGSYGGLPPQIDPWLWQSIVVTLCCCLPLGIVGIVFASQAQTEMSRGNFGEARVKAGQAKTFTLIGMGVGIAAILLSILLVTV